MTKLSKAQEEIAKLTIDRAMLLGALTVSILHIAPEHKELWDFYVADIRNKVGVNDEQ